MIDKETILRIARECQLLDGLSVVPSQVERFAAAIEAETIKRLAAGVSVDPDGWRTQEYIGAPSQQEPYYNADTFTTAIAAARVQMNERCAKFFDENDTAMFWGSSAAKRIRALLGKEAQS